MSNGRNPIISGSGMAVFISILLFLYAVLPLDNTKFGWRILIALIAIVIFFLGLRFSRG